MDSKRPNTFLRRQRENRGWSQKKVAELLGTSEDVIGKWERGERKPSPFYQEKFCTLYNLSAEELGFVDPAPSQTHILVPSFDQTLNDQLDDAESVIDLAWEVWFASKPQQAAREITRHLPKLEHLLRTHPTSPQALRIRELVMHCHGLLGTIRLDALENDSALFHYKHAQQLASESHDIEQAATYIALIGDTLRRQGEKLKAISYMEQAQDQATTTGKATQGFIRQLLAYTYADTNHEPEFERTIQEATDLLAFSSEANGTAKKEFVPFEIYEIRGKANRDLGKPLQALTYLDLAEASLKRMTVTPRWHAVLDISRGQALCDTGDLTTGIELASRGFLLAYQCRSPRQMNRVRKLLKKLEAGPGRNEPAVLALKELLYETYLHLDLET